MMMLVQTTPALALLDQLVLALMQQAPHSLLTHAHASQDARGIPQPGLVMVSS